MALHRIATYNIALASRKSSFLPDPHWRADVIVGLMKKLEVEFVCFQEAARRWPRDDAPLLFDEILANSCPKSQVHFQPAVAQGLRNMHPFGKLKSLRSQGIQRQEQGMAIWIRPLRRNSLALRNLACDQSGEAAVEASRPLPHPLYFGSRREPPCREDEDRPVCWCRLAETSKFGENGAATIYMGCVHLPTLLNERRSHPVTTFTRRQREIMHVTLGLKEVANVDELASALRLHCLKHIVSQAEQLEAFWKDRKVIIALAGDFNVNFLAETPPAEYRFLQGKGYSPVKTRGLTRTEAPPRLIDNIWIKNLAPDRMREIPAPTTVAGVDLSFLSDHLPVIAEIDLC